jgi:hypothetical protein
MRDSSWFRAVASCTGQSDRVRHARIRARGPRPQGPHHHSDRSLDAGGGAVRSELPAEGERRTPSGKCRLKVGGTTRKVLLQNGVTLRGRALFVSMTFVSLLTLAESAIHNADSGPEHPDNEVATLLLADADWVRIDSGERLEKEEYDRIKLLPGEHRIKWCRKFGVSFMVDPTMSAA